MEKYLLKHLRLVVAFVIGGVALLVEPADLEKKGSYSGKFGWYSMGKTFELDKDHFYFTGEASGTFFNDAGKGFLHLSSVICPHAYDSNKGTDTADGYCAVTDQDGDKAFLAWKCSGKTSDRCNGDFQWTGGTGKYNGIKGNNTFFGLNIAPTASGYSEWKGQWELP